MAGLRLLHTPGSPEAVRRRMERLTPGTPARWGRLDAPRMQAHLGDQSRIALGDLAGPLTEAAWSPHPGFGALGGRDWSRLAWRHFDHHLTRFGV